jgi:hypothetical protein
MAALNSYDMLLEAADNMAEIGVQGAPVKQRDLMDDRFFKSLNLLDRYSDPDVDKAVEEAWAQAQSASQIETSHDINVRHSMNDDTAVRLISDEPFVGSDDQLDTVEEELHNLFLITDKSQTETVKALGASAKSLSAISTRLEKWFSWEQEEAWRAKAHAKSDGISLPVLYQGDASQQPDADFLDGFDTFDSNRGGNGGGSRNRRKTSRTRPDPGNRPPRPPANKSLLQKFKGLIRKGRGKGALLATLAMGGAVLWGMSEDDQSTKNFASDEDETDRDVSVEDGEDLEVPDSVAETPASSPRADAIDEEEAAFREQYGVNSDEELPEIDITPTAGDVAVMSVLGAASAPGAVNQFTGARNAKNTASAIRQVVKGTRGGAGLKGNAAVSALLGSAEALAVHYDDSLTDEEKNREYAKIGGGTAGALAGGAAGAAGGATVGAWIGGIGGATLGSVVPGVGTVAGGAAGAAGGALIGSLVMGYLGSLFGGEAGEAASEYVYDKVEQIGEREEKQRKDGEDINIVVDTQPVADVLEENAKRDEELQKKRDAEDKPFSSPIWRFNSPMMPDPSVSSAPMPASNMSGLLRATKGDVAGAGPMPQFSASGPMRAPSLISMTDEQRQIIKEVSGGDEKAERFLTGVLNVENRGFGQVRSDAVSPAGAMGPYQVMPATWQGLVRQGKASGDPRNFGDATRAMKAMYDEVNKTYDGNEVAMVAHYNGGNKEGRARLAGEGDFSKLPKETRDYLKYYFSGNQTAEQRESKPEMVSEVNPVERHVEADVERADLTTMKQPIVNVEVPPQEAPKVAAQTKTPEPPPMLAASAPSYSGGAGSTPTLDDMPILIADNGMLSMHTGKI